MKFEGTEVFGFTNAFIGMRLPKNKDYESAKAKSNHVGNMKLSKMLNAEDNAGHGNPNSKFMRMIHVQTCISAPLCWWKEFDTYKVGTTRNSTSTMHKIQSFEINEDCFEKNPITDKISCVINIGALEGLRKEYNRLADEIKELSSNLKREDGTIDPEVAWQVADKRRVQKAVWYDIIYGLPDSWIQTAMVDLDYTTIRNMYFWRKDHKQNCWSGKDNMEMVSFCKWVEALPFAQELILGEDPVEE